MTRLWTIGHSTRTLDELAEALQSFGVKTLADVRRFPASRRNPQFQTDALRRGLHTAGISYLYFGDELGGWRQARPDSPNVGLRNTSFRGYADWMATPTFRAGVVRLLKTASESSTCVMCAERPISNCHRSLLADYLTLVHEVEVTDVSDVGKGEPHRLTRGVQRADDTVVYLRPEGPVGLGSFGT